MTATTDKGFDTLKVLAKRIAPGQEHLDVQFESLGKHQWYSDHGTGKTDNVFVSGPQSAIDALLTTVIPQSSHSPGNWYLWGFNSRSEADRFVHALYPHPLSYWQVGLSRSFVLASEVPLYGYFRESASNSLGASDELLLTERFRAQARKIADEAGKLRPRTSIIFVSYNVSERAQLSSMPGGQGGTVMTAKKDIICSYLFDDSKEAKACFSRAASCGVGEGWHFGFTGL